MAKKKQTLTTFRGLDPETDLNQPVRREPSSPESEPTQESLPGAEAESTPAPSVNGNKCVAHFVRLRPDQNEGERFLAFEMALQLSEEVAKILPPLFQDAWATLSDDAAIRRLDLSTDEPIDWEIYVMPEDPSPAVLPAVIPSKVRVQSVEETGSGKGRQIIRLSFSIVIPMDVTIGRWALDHYGDLVWLQVEETNRRLPLTKAAKG
jgi:hypothetical protein